jgi:hypothetical protein
MYTDKKNNKEETCFIRVNPFLSVANNCLT